jgi:sugar transferase (PEP-CTERM/EpsH1 system associated)
MRILFLTHRLPYAPNRGDRIRAYHVLRALGARFTVDLVSLVHSAEEEGCASELRESAASVSTARVSRVRGAGRAVAALVTGGTLTHALLDAPGLLSILSRVVRENPPDVVLAYCTGMARFAMAAPLDRFPLILDMVDVDSQKWHELGQSARAPRSWVFEREAALLSKFELMAATCARTTLVVNQRERDRLQLIAPSARIAVVENGVDVSSFRPPSAPTSEARVVFCGVLNYPPNEEAASWLMNDIWPSVRRVRPDARLALVGSSPTPVLRRLAAEDATVELVGNVPDVRPYLWNAAVSVAPLRVSRGVQNKVLEALAAGLPVVVTKAVGDGLPASVLPGCTVETTSDGLAGSLVRLLSSSGSVRRSIANRVDLARLSWSAQLAPLFGILEDTHPPHCSLEMSRAIS